MSYGNRNKNAYIISGFMRLTHEEAYAIRCRMGLWGGEGKRNVDAAFELYELALLFHTADKLATFVDEREEKK